MRHESASAKAVLGGLEIARGHSNPNHQLSEAVARDPYLGGVVAGRYFAEMDAHGLAATYTPKQARWRRGEHRQAADSVIVGGDGMRLEGASATSREQTAGTDGRAHKAVSWKQRSQSAQPGS
jgi:hypothetical protein